jgi:hypothetical protein
MAGITFEKWLEAQDIHNPTLDEIDWAKAAWEFKETNCASCGCMMCQEMIKNRKEVIANGEMPIVRE